MEHGVWEEIKMENPQSIKMSKKGKEFIKQIQINRIKLDLESVTQVEALELICKYFKTHNKEYLEMVKEVKNV